MAWTQGLSPNLSSGFNAKNFGMASGMGGIAGGLMGLFGGNNNPADSAMPYLQQIPEAMRPYFQPYMQAGEKALPQLESQYGNLMNNPGGELNKIGQGFQQSPGFQSALKEALQAGNQAAAAGGMAGSPMHEQQNMQLATNLGNQDFYNWLEKAMGMFGQGLQGTQGLANMGFGASKSMSDQIAQALAAQSALSYAGSAAQNQSEGAGMQNILSGLGTLAAFL